MAATNVQTALSYSQQEKNQRSWWSILKKSASEWLDADAMTWAAAIACYTLLALAPLLVVAIKIATVMLRGQGKAIDTIRKNAIDWFGRDGGQAIGAILDKIVQQRSGVIASIISGVLVIVSIGGVFAEVQQAMNRVWKLKVKPGGAMMAFIRARLKSIVVLGAAALVLLASIIVAGWIQHLTSQSGTLWKFFDWIIDLIANLVALTLIFALVFKAVPDAEMGWRTTWTGAIITTVLFMVGKYALAFYFRFAAPSSAFGAVGSLAAILIWIYYSAQIVLFGAVFTQVFSKVRGHGVRPSPHAEFLSECDETETATPSDEDPRDKPTRPSGREPVSWEQDEEDYASVLGRHVPGERKAISEVQEEANGHTALLAGLTLVLGGVLGGISTALLRNGKKPRSGTVAAAALDRRMQRVEQRLGHISRIRQYLEQDNVNQRINQLEKRIQQTARQAAKAPSRAARKASFTHRAANVFKSIF